MGTPPLCALLFTYATSVGVAIWSYAAWSKWIGSSLAPWDAQYSDSEISQSDLIAMRSFVDEYLKKGEGQRARFLESRKDSHTAGRHVLLQWFTDAWKNAKLNDEVDKILQSHDRLPHQLVGRATKQVSTPTVRGSY